MAYNKYILELSPNKYGTFLQSILYKYSNPKKCISIMALKTNVNEQWNLIIFIDRLFL